MLKSFKELYLEKHWKLNRWQWFNYFEDGSYDLSILDNEIYELVSLYSDKIKIDSRESEVANLLIQRALVDKNPQVSQLRNYIDDLENYSKDVSNEIKKDNHKYKLAMARKMKKDVLDLMSTRDSLAIDTGYTSYPDLVLNTEEINRERLITLLNNYLDKNIDKAKGIINKYNITLKNWFQDLDNVDKVDRSYDPKILIEKLTEAFGFTGIAEKIKIDYGSEGFSGYASELSPNEINIAIEPIESLNDLRTLFHELGHAIFYSLNDEEGLLRILPASLDEAMAVAFEYIAPTLLLEGEDRERIYELMDLEYTRCAMSALFEFELWEEPDKAEELYEKHYSKFGLGIEDPSIWAYDSFRSIDPVYIHNYVLGAALAERLIEYLSERYLDDYKSWGQWLYNNIYSEGRRKTLKDKIIEISDLI